MKLVPRAAVDTQIIPIEGKTFVFEPIEPFHDPVKYKFTENQLAELDWHVQKKCGMYCAIVFLVGCAIGAATMFGFNYTDIYHSGYDHAVRDCNAKVADVLERYNNLLAAQ